MADSATLLGYVEDAISSLTQGLVQSYKIDGREFTYLDLAELRRMRTQLRRECAAQTHRKKGLFGRVRWGDS